MISAGHVAEMAERHTLRHADRQTLAEVVLQRAEWLDSSDRALIEQVFGRGGRPREMAAILQVSPRTVQRRIRELVRRLTDPQVLVVLRRQGRWDRTIGSVALAHWVRRRTYRQIGAEKGLTLYEVRQQIQFARGLIAGEMGKQR